MKKSITLIIFLLSILTSCGPRRMKCGVGRKCIVEKSNIGEKVTRPNVNS